MVDTATGLAARVFSLAIHLACTMTATPSAIAACPPAPSGGDGRAGDDGRLSRPKRGQRTEWGSPGLFFFLIKWEKKVMGCLDRRDVMVQYRRRAGRCGNHVSASMLLPHRPAGGAPCQGLVGVSTTALVERAARAQHRRRSQSGRRNPHRARRPAHNGRSIGIETCRTTPEGRGPTWPRGTQSLRR